MQAKPGFLPAIAIVSFVLLAGCQGASSADESTIGASAPAGAVEHSSEAIIGPDEAFFAAQYLQEVFIVSKAQSQPDLQRSAGLSGEASSVFDFAANFSDERLTLMAGALLSLGDTDKDGFLNEQEFQALRLDPSVLGARGEILNHQYKSSLFRQLVGEGTGIGASELQLLLRGLGPTIKQELDRKSSQEQRLSVRHAWDEVLATYDQDHDGTLSLVEQKNLRQERARLMARFLP